MALQREDHRYIFHFILVTVCDPFFGTVYRGGGCQTVAQTTPVVDAGVGTT